MTKRAWLLPVVVVAAGAGLAQAQQRVPAPQPAPSAAPQPTVSAPAPARPLPAYTVKGFRSATFGMTKEQVLKAIEQDFAIKADKVTLADNDVERTSSLTVTVPHLDPAPGAATISYVLGATSKKLIHVNVVWATGAEPNDNERRSMLAAGVLLVNYFRGFSWANDRAVLGMPVGPNAIVLFAAGDTAGGGVQVQADGVQFERVGNDGKTETSPTPHGPASLRVAYAQNTTSPDIYRIEPGKF